MTVDGALGGRLLDRSSRTQLYVCWHRWRIAPSRRMPKRSNSGSSGSHEYGVHWLRHLSRTYGCHVILYQ